MKTRLPKIGAVIASLAIHLALLLLLFGKNEQRDSTLWSGGNSQKNLAPVFVTLSKSTVTNLSPAKQVAPVKPASLHLQRVSASTNSSLTQLPKPTPSRTNKNPSSGLGFSDTPRGGEGPGLDSKGTVAAQAPHILASIRKRIMREQFYPREAREKKLSGTVRVGFKILDSGQLKYVRVIQSSGKPVLDKAALATINRATPLPYYPEDIALSLEYLLK